MELKEGMYVRTKNGYIDKIILMEYAEERKQNYPNHPSKNRWRDKMLLLKAGYWSTTQNIIKASYNIIDLIEVGDYVNEKKVIYVDYLTNGPRKGTKVVDYYIAPNTLNYFTNEDIKSIVTHEQFDAMKYEVK